MSVKQILYSKCEEALNSRLVVLQQKISDIQNDLQLETKSSAGDKHETGRAMLQLEREKVGQQLAEVQKLQELLQKIDMSSKHERIALGSVVLTSDKNYYISISAGEIKVNSEIFYAISAATPIAKLLLGKAKKETISFRSSTFVITEVL